MSFSECYETVVAQEQSAGDRLIPRTAVKRLALAGQLTMATD